MTEAVIPTWWLVVTAIVCTFMLFSTITWIVVGIMIIKNVMPLIKDINAKVNSIGTDVKEITGNVKQTVNLVQARTSAIVGSAETGSAEVTRKVSMASAGLTGVFTVFRVLKFLRRMI